MHVGPHSGVVIGARVTLRKHGIGARVTQRLLPIRGRVDPAPCSDLVGPFLEFLRICRRVPVPGVLYVIRGRGAVVLLTLVDSILADRRDCRRDRGAMKGEPRAPIGQARTWVRLAELALLFALGFFAFARP